EPLSRAVAPAALSPGEDRRVYRGVEHGDQNPDHEQLEILGRQYPHAGRSHFTGEPHTPVYTRRAMKPSRFDVIAGLGARAQLLEGHFRSRPGPAAAQPAGPMRPAGLEGLLRGYAQAQTTAFWVSMPNSS